MRIIIIETDPESTQMLELADKDLKIVIIIICHIFKNLIQGRYRKT